MGEQRLIHSNSFGYVSMCTCCKDFHVCLGSVVMVFGQLDFQEFKNQFFALNNISFCRIHRDGRVKRFIFQTSLPDLTLSLSEIEYNLTVDLFNISNIELMIDENLSRS